MTKYGNEKTHLTLTNKALKFYNETDPLNIYEREVDVENEEGEIVDVKYVYDVDGVFNKRGLTEGEINGMFESLADEFAII